jgi:hypothetical protein
MKLKELDYNLVGARFCCLVAGVCLSQLVSIVYEGGGKDQPHSRSTQTATGVIRTSSAAKKTPSVLTSSFRDRADRCMSGSRDRPSRYEGLGSPCTPDP